MVPCSSLLSASSKEWVPVMPTATGTPTHNNSGHIHTSPRHTAQPLSRFVCCFFLAKQKPENQKMSEIGKCMMSLLSCVVVLWGFCCVFFFLSCCLVRFVLFVFLFVWVGELHVIPSLLQSALLGGARCVRVSVLPCLLCTSQPAVVGSCWCITHSHTLSLEGGWFCCFVCCWAAVVFVVF